MRTSVLLAARRFGIFGACLAPLAMARAVIIFSDNFDSGASPLWGNESGSWTASGGAYYATLPNNNPNAYSSVPYNLRDFTVDFDITDVTDGGIFLRAAPAPGTASGIKGVLLNLKVPGGSPRVYWHIFYDGNDSTPPLNVAYMDYGANPHVHIEVSGTTYSVFLNGSPTPITTLTTNFFSSGFVALYDFSSQSFDNFVLQIPTPQLFIRMESDAAVISWSTAFLGYTLQTTADLSQPTAWSSLNGPYASSGGYYQFRLPLINLLRKQYFRLSYTAP